MLSCHPTIWKHSTKTMMMRALANATVVPTRPDAAFRVGVEEAAVVASLVLPATAFATTTTTRPTVTLAGVMAVLERDLHRLPLSPTPPPLAAPRRVELASIHPIPIARPGTVVGTH